MRCGAVQCSTAHHGVALYRVALAFGGEGCCNNSGGIVVKSEAAVAAVAAVIEGGLKVG